jgi:hypothetical protein
VAQLFSLGSMSAINPITNLLKVGAWICLLIGAYMSSILIMILVTGHTGINSTGDALVMVAFVIFTFFAFVPFYGFVFPRFKSPRKSVSLAVGSLEVLVITLFLFAVLFPRL